jgi:small GTP-binding protein
MLRQAFIVKGNDVIYKRTYANALSNSEVEDLSYKLKREAMKKLGKAIGYYDYLRFRVSYIVEIDFDLIFVFVTGLVDDFFRIIRGELLNFKNRFMNLFETEVNRNELNKTDFIDLDSILDKMHRNIATKIAVVGFSGVGKTTIKRLIRLDEIPLQHIPTISGDIATIRIGKLEFRLFDFAGQDEFKYLWKGFLRGSHAVLVVTDSTPRNIEKSRFFMDLIQAEVPNSRHAIIGNKQDLKNAMTVEEIEDQLSMKTYPMVANKSENRNKMIRILAEVMDINPESSPLIAELFQTEPINVFEKDTKGDIAEIAENGENGDVESQKMVDTGILSRENIQTVGSKTDLQDISDRKQLIKQQVSRQNIQEVDVAIDVCDEVAKEILGAGENPLETHYEMISATLKTLNNGKEYTYEEFYESYLNYVKKLFICDNIPLKQFLEPQFSLLKKSIGEEGIVAPNAKKNISAIMNALNCAFLTMCNPNEFPNFAALLKHFRLYVLDTTELNETRTFYRKCMQRIVAW